MSEKIDGREVCRMIAAGDLDEWINEIGEARKRRRSLLQDAKCQELIATARPGDTVRFTRGISPKSMEGLRAIVVKCNYTRVVLKMHKDDAAHCRFGSGEFNCPASVLALEA